LGRRHVLLEEPQVRDAAIALNEALAIEHVAWKDEQLVPNARFGRDIVAEDIDTIHDGRSPLVDVPTEIHRRDRVGADAPALDDWMNARVDVALVRVRFLDLSCGIFPRICVKD